MAELALSYLAGLLTTLSPCVLPMIPLVLAGTMKGGKLGPIAFGAGMLVAFTTIGLFIASVGLGLGIDGHVLRQAAAAMFILMGLTLLVQPLQTKLALATAGIANSANTLADRADIGGLTGPFLIGGLAGAIWSPCSGPSLGAAIALAAGAGGLGEAGLRMFAFGLGAATILMLLAYGSRTAIMGRRDSLMSAASWIKPGAAIIFIGVGAMILTGLDKTVEIALLKASPEWLLNLTTSY